MRRSLSLLERTGLVSRQRGRGTIISPPKIDRWLAPSRPLEDDFRQHDGQFQTRVVEYKRQVLAPGFVTERLRLAPDTPVGFIGLVRQVDNRIICHDRRYFPAEIAARLDESLVEDHPISDILHRLGGVQVTAAEWETEILPAPHDVAITLDITPGLLVVVNTGTEYQANGAATQVGQVFYRIDRVRFKFSIRFDHAATPLR
jgi:GntR family transcriptional regulator